MHGWNTHAVGIWLLGKRCPPLVAAFTDLTTRLFPSVIRVATGIITLCRECEDRNTRIDREDWRRLRFPFWIFSSPSVTWECRFYPGPDGRSVTDASLVPTEKVYLRCLLREPETVRTR
jgi:hypothetical protein